MMTTRPPKTTPAIAPTFVLFFFDIFEFDPEDVESDPSVTPVVVGAGVDEEAEDDPELVGEGVGVDEVDLDVDVDFASGYR